MLARTNLAATAGIEPTMPESKSDVLPLHHVAMNFPKKKAAQIGRLVRGAISKLHALTSLPINWLGLRQLLSYKIHAEEFTEL